MIYHPGLSREMWNVSAGLLVGLSIIGVGCAQTRATTEDYGSHLRTFTYSVGPVDLPAAHGHHAVIGERFDAVEDPSLPRRWITVPEDGWLTGFVPSVVDQEGQPLPNRLLHHVTLFNRGGTEPSDGTSVSYRWNLGNGAELSPINFPDGYGLRVEAGDQLEMIAMFHNPLGRDFPAVSVQADITFSFQRAGRPELKPLIHVVSNVDGPGHMGYWVPPGQDERVEEFQFPVAGTVVFMAAHLHAYGQSLTVEDVDRQRVIWVGKAELTPDGQIVRIPTWSSKTGLHVLPEETYRLVVRYDNPTSEPVDAMGFLMAFMNPDSDP